MSIMEREDSNRIESKSGHGRQKDRNIKHLLHLSAVLGASLLLAGPLLYVTGTINDPLLRSLRLR
jgi:hypothetical protein